MQHEKNPSYNTPITFLRLNLWANLAVYFSGISEAVISAIVQPVLALFNALSPMSLLESLIDTAVSAIWGLLGLTKVDVTGLIVPPASYSPTGSWSEQDLKDFKSFEAGNSLIWTGCTPELIAAHAKFKAECAKKGWTVEETSAYRPLIYQAHFYDLVYGPASKTPEGKADAEKHGLGTAVASPDPNNAHVKGTAFDAVIRDGKTALNSKTTPNKAVQDVAKLCGLRNNIPNDYIDFRL